MKTPHYTAPHFTLKEALQAIAFSVFMFFAIWFLTSVSILIWG